MFLLILRLLEAVLCRQRLFEIRLVPCWYRLELCHICVNPPSATVNVNLFFSLRARPGVLYAVKELSRRLQRPRRPRVSQEDGEVPPWTRDIALELRPRKSPLPSAAPQTASSGAMVWLIGALASSLFGHEGSSPCRHQKQSAPRAQWESPKQRSLSPLSSTGESPQRSSISLTTVA